MDEQPKETTKKINKVIFDIGFLLLLFIVMNILVTTIFQIVNIPMSIANIIAASVVTIATYLLFNRKKINKNNMVYYAISIIITTLICIISTYCMGKVFDTSCDGNFYHKTAIGIIKEGWNPLYEDSEEFCKNHDTEIENKGQFLWIDHYPKVTWNFAASIYSVTNNIESGKVITVLLIVSALCMTSAYLSNRFLKKWQAILIAIALTINPIVNAQIFTYYVDGIMGLLIYGIILFLIVITDEKCTLISNKEKWLGLGAQIALCMNIKFTGVYFAAIFSIVFYVFWLAKSLKMNKFKETFWKTTLKFVVIVFIGIGVIGASTYMRNIIDHKNPLYPIIGKDKVDIITTMQPESFGEKNRFVKLFESVFSTSENITYASGDSPELKLPFKVNDQEMESLAIPDTRIGGYGVWFSGITIIAIITLMYSMIIIFKENKEIFKYLIAILLGIVITTLCMAEAWWARYSPQLYLIPISSMFSMFYIANINENKIRKVLINTIATIVFVLMILNVSTFIYWRVKDVETSKSVEISIDNLKTYLEENNVNEISFNETNYYGILFNMRDYGVKYKITENKENKEHYAYNYQILY